MGTSHTFQCGNADLSERCVASFESELRILLGRYKIKRIAEEMSSDGLKHQEVTETIAHRVANDLRLPYDRVDLGRKERSDLSLGDSTVIQVMKSFKIRDVTPFR